MKSHLLVAMSLAALVAICPAAAEAALTIEAFLEVPVLDRPAVSPDGKQLAYVRTQRSVADDDRTSQIWLADVAAGTTGQITYHDKGARAPAWRPGGGLTYLANRGDGTQIWLNPLDGSEPRPLTEVEEGIHGFWWGPDGRQIVVLMRGEEEEEEGRSDGDRRNEEGEREEEGEEEEEKGDFTVFDRLEDPEEFPQLWIFEADDEGPVGDPRQLTSPPLHANHAAWSPDGRQIALTYNPRFSSLVDEEQRIGLVDVDSGELTPFTDPRRHSSLAAFSPDGRQLVYFTDRSAEGRAYLNVKVLVVREVATGKEFVLSQGTDLALGGTGPVPSVAPRWTDDGRAVLVTGARGTTHDLYRVAHPSGRVDAVTELRGNLRRYAVGGKTLAYVESELHRPGTLWTRKLRGGAPTMIHSTDDAVTDLGLVAPTKLALPGADEGVVVEGFLFLPPGAEMAGDLPTIIEMHGGPYARYSNSWTTRYPWHVLAHEGFAVFIANPRGGTGYGEAFQQAIYRGFGRDDYRDLMAAVDALVEQGISDEDRLGFTGYSYGGLMTNVVVSRTSRFRAAVSIAGLFNYVSAMGQSNPQLLIDSYDTPWDGDLGRLWEDSPASRAASITTPTLIMHGTEDTPVDPRQSIEMFTYLQLNGVPSRLVLYEGEGHGINRPVHMVDYETREVQWFRHYLLGDTEAEGAAAPLPVVPND